MADDMSSQPDDYDAEKRQEEFDSFQQYVEQPPTPPKLLVNGNDVKSLFSNITPGPWISEILSEMQSRQDAGEFSTYEEAMAVEGAKTTAEHNSATFWLESGAELGVGTNNLDQIELVEMTL